MGKSANRGGVNAEESVIDLKDFFVFVVVYATKGAFLTDQISSHSFMKN